MYLGHMFRSIDHHQAVYTKLRNRDACSENSIHVIWDPVRLKNALTFWRRIFYQILAHSVFKMRVIRKPNKVAL